jgi:hypothetical protein
MSPLEALRILDAMSAATPASRTDHARAAEAVHALKEVIDGLPSDNGGTVAAD